MKHKGSISHKHLSFATLDLIWFYSPHLVCPTVHKEGKTQRTGRRSRGRGTRSGDGGRANGKATTHASGIMSSLFIYFFVINSCSCTHLYMFLVYTDMFSSSCILLLSPFLPFPEQMSPLMRRSPWNPRPKKKGIWKHCRAGWRWEVCWLGPRKRWGGFC